VCIGGVGKIDKNAGGSDKVYPVYYRRTGRREGLEERRE